ncbi:MAG: circularly permuted type 2 ATP-grasp protein [Pirellula sp.]|nr:circularly permuted type 2 ATP-grasp protein [Pirellula sp.]
MPDQPQLEPHPITELFPSYRCPNSSYDELLQNGLVRDHYHSLLGIQPRLNGAELYLRWQTIKRSLRDNPSASTGQLTKTDASRIWELDPIPYVIPEDQWHALARGVEQRVRLLDLILRDVYGDQKLIANGTLPPEVVFGTKNYLRAMRGATPDERIIYLYACQVVREPNGVWCALADRTQGPSGGGLAVENRLAISRVLESDFRSMNVMRLASFFAGLREQLNAPEYLKTPKSARNVLLSPGVASPTFFEDAYLARYLGYTLTQTSDLTVRGGDVYLKTLGGLVSVDSILRRIPDIDCDPLELNTQSSSGIAGLCQAVRDKQVRVANQLGSGWAESPALTALLPRLCQSVLGEDLILQNTPMHWCGDPESLAYVTRDIERFAFRDAFVRHSSSDWYFHRASETDRNRFLDMLRAKPWSYVAVEAPRPSYSPTWHGNRVVAWPTVLRLFASATKSGFEVMPGGIARVADREDKVSESLIAGLMSKDVWVLSSNKVKPISLLPANRTITEVRRSAMDLPSRVAEHLFWLGRGTERTEGMARHARLCVSQLAGEIEPELLGFHWQVVYALSSSEGTLSETPPPDASSHVEEMRREVLQFLYQADRPMSLHGAMVGIRQNAEIIRDRLSFDSWQLLSKLDMDYLMPWVDRREKLGDAGVFLNQMTTLLSAFAGLISENMTRGPGWLFLEIGRRIERAYGLIRLVELLLVPGGRPISPLIESLLEICDSSMTYRYRYLMNYEVAPTLDLLLFDPSNPRSIAFQFVKIVENLEGLTSASKVDITRMRRAMMDARGMMRLFDADSLSVEVTAPESPYPRRVHLQELLNQLTQSLNELVDFLSQRFLTHTVSVRHLEDAANQ